MIILYLNKVCMIDFTSWFFVLKYFKLQQFNIISFFLFFVQSDPDVFHLNLTALNIGIKVINFWKLD